MSRAEPGISEAIVGVVRRAIEGLGFDPRSVDAAPIGLVVPGRAADALIDCAADRLRDPALGLTVAARIPIGGLGDIDYGLCTSPSLRDALRLVTRYYSLATQRVRLELVEHQPIARLQFHRSAGVDQSRHWVEFAVAMFAIRIRQTLGDDALGFHRVAFPHAAPMDRSVHDRFFGTRVEFDAADECLALPAAWLDRPLQTASRSLAALLESQMQELAPAMAPIDPVLDRVRRTLAAMLDEGHIDLDTLAARMGESKRTLQRLLRDRDASHSQLLDELRRHRAAVLLEQGLRVAEVSERLGFSEPSAFFRAYRRWTGTSPRGKAEPLE